MIATTGCRQRFERLVFQLHIDHLLSAGNVVAIAVEHASDDGQSIVVSTIRLAEAEMPHINPREDREPRFGFSGLEELRVQYDRQIADLVAREERLLHFLLRLLQPDRSRGAAQSNRGAPAIEDRGRSSWRPSSG